MLFMKVKHVHMVGIGGYGMSGIAEVLHNMGFKVTGSDIKKSYITRYLEGLGINIVYEHRPENITGADVVVFSSAISEDNIELVEAKKRMIPVIRRAEMLAELMRMKYSIAVSGAHGKTTTTSMIALVLEEGGFDPTIVIGGRLKGLGTGAKLGQGQFLVAEADESDRSFLLLYPTISVITNIDREHLDHYSGSFENLKRAFIDFANRVPFYGCSIVNVDDETTRSIIPHLKKRVITYGLNENAQIRAIHLQGRKYRIQKDGKELGILELRIPGKHNVKNALAAVTVAMELDIPAQEALRTLSKFRGVERRFELKGRLNGAIIIDDYAHHPREIKAVVETAIEEYGVGPIVVFQPHRYTRTRDLHMEFGDAFVGIKKLIITDIYPAGEKPIKGVTTQLIIESVKRKNPDLEIIWMKNFDEIVDYLRENIKEGDVVLTLGAGDIWKVCESLLKAGKKV